LSTSRETDIEDLEPTRLELRSADIVEPRAEELRALFPEAVRDGKLDLEALAAALGDVVDDGPERFGLTWPGKSAAIRMAQRPSEGTLVPMEDESVDWDTTKNVIVEGENLEVLKVLQRSYHGRVKLIYIDPPYNTGKDFVYSDNFRDPLGEYLRFSQQTDENGNRLRANTESSGRYHSSWLSMMWPRLHLARSLLSDDGVIVVSIDDVEAPRLRLVLDEIFGEENFVGVIGAQVNPRGRHLNRFIAQTHDSLIIYVRDHDGNALRGLPKGEAMVAEYRKNDERGLYRELELRNRNPQFNSTTRPNLFYKIWISPASGSVSLESDDEHTVEVLPRDSQGNESCWTWSKDLLASNRDRVRARPVNDGYRIFRRDYLYDEAGSAARTLPKSLWLEPELNNDYGKRAVRELLSTVEFDFPKSPGLIRKIVQMGSAGEDIVLDFFSGSGTTGQAVYEENESDGGARRFVCVQLPESLDSEDSGRTLAQLTRDRVRASGLSLLAPDNPSLDTGFRAYRLDRSATARPQGETDELVFDVGPGVPLDRDDEALLAEVLLARGFDLVTDTKWVGVEGAKAADVADGALLACFARSLTSEQFEALVDREPAQLVLLEEAFGANDEVKINALQHLKTSNAHRETAIELLLL